MVAGAIAATVLLANNRRNLNHVMRSLGIPIVETMVIPKPGTMEKFKGKRLKDITLMVDAYVFMPEIKGKQSVFLRNMRKDGETLCALFERLGFKMSTWQPGSFAKNVNECYNEETIPNTADPDNPSSFFLMIKGAPDGTLISTRVKFIFNDAASRTRLTDMAAKVLTEYAKATTWTEIAEQKGKLMMLQPFDSSLFGFSARFTSEFSGTGRYNLIFSRTSPLTVEQKRTVAYFDRTKFFPLTPDYGGPQFATGPAKS
ncbi:MAG: hypothetical protein JWM58_1973 [Rhizobium sp.]|nr:hypothetical protein [Rhizobium sp.]